MSRSNTPRLHIWIPVANLIPTLFWIDWQNPNGLITKMAILWFIAFPVAIVMGVVSYLLLVWLPAALSSRQGKLKTRQLLTITAAISAMLTLRFLGGTLQGEWTWQHALVSIMVPLHLSFFPGIMYVLMDKWPGEKA